MVFFGLFSEIFNGTVPLYHQVVITAQWLFDYSIRDEILKRDPKGTSDPIFFKHSGSNALEDDFVRYSKMCIRLFKIKGEATIINQQ